MLLAKVWEKMLCHISIPLVLVWYHIVHDIIIQMLVKKEKPLKS